MTNQPILSIIIPTRNRAEYAKSSIRNVLSIPASDIELVIQDNSDNDELEQHIATLNDNRICYNHSRERLDVIANFDKAASTATGEYVCYIGDDDGVNPEIVEAARWAKTQNLDALLPSTRILYYWPDLRFRYYGDKFSGSLIMSSFTGRKSYPDTEKEMRRCAKLAGHNFCSLPKLYYGIVRRECTEQVRAKTGSYFPGPSPDLSGAMAVANYVKRMCEIDYPLFIHGNSSKSTAGLGTMKKHVGRLEEQAHLPRKYVSGWSDLVPAFFAGSTIWGEDVVQALKAVEREDILRDFNFPLLHAMCLAFNPKYASFIMGSFFKAVRASRRGYLPSMFRFAAGYAFIWGRRAKFLLARLLLRFSRSESSTIKDIDNVENAAIALCDNLRAAGHSLEKYL